MFSLFIFYVIIFLEELVKEMKKLYKSIMVLYIVALLLTGCGKKSLEGTITSLLDGIKNGKTNDVIKKYCNNYELLESNEEDDEYGIRKLIFSKMTYKIVDKEENGSEATIYLELKTVDVSTIFEKLQSDLVIDDEYLRLTSEEMKEYSLKRERDMITNLDEEYFRIVKIGVNAKKENGNWKIDLTDELIYALSGLKY